MGQLRVSVLWSRRLVGLGMSFFVTLILGVAVLAQGPQAHEGYSYDVRSINMADLGMRAPVGLAYSQQAQALLVLQEIEMNGNQPTVDVAAIDLGEELAAISHIPANVGGNPNIAFDEQSGTLVFLDQSGIQLAQVTMQAGDGPEMVVQNFIDVDVDVLALNNPQGMAFDPQGGALYLLEGSARQIVRVVPESGQSLEVALTAGNVERLDLNALPPGPLGGLAFEAATRHLFVLDASGHMLYELDQSGVLLATRDLSSLQLQSPQGMVFAPSGDPTDHPEEVSLYIANTGQTPGVGEIVEVSLTPPELLPNLPALATDAFLVQTILTSQWNPPSPDPSGIAYHSSLGRLIVSDGEVNEMDNYYEDVNVFEATTHGNLEKTCNTTRDNLEDPWDFSNEPTGVAINPANGHIFFSDDSRKQINEVNPGPDGEYCTNDDTVTSFSTRTFKSDDPEGLAFGGGRLFIVDGVGAEVYVLSPGGNGVFDGVPPDGDDGLMQWDVEAVGLRDPEGIAYHPQTGTLFVVSSREYLMGEMTVDGTVVELIALDFISGADKPAGAAIGPGSQDPDVLNIYITDRGVDNNDDPNENDGKIYEVDLGREEPTATPTNTPTATNTPTNTPKATNTPTPTNTATPTNTPTPTNTATSEPPTVPATATATPKASPPTVTPTLPLHFFMPIVEQHHSNGTP